MIIPKLEIGMSKVTQRTITEADTGMHFGSGSLKNLLATPVLAEMMIDAAVKVVDPLLGEGYITIGKILNINHLAPTTKGMIITVEATIVKIEDSKITFKITAYDEIGEVGIGHHERYIANKVLLDKKVENRTEVLRPTP